MAHAEYLYRNFNNLNGFSVKQSQFDGEEYSDEADLRKKSNYDSKFALPLSFSNLGFQVSKATKEVNIDGDNGRVAFKNVGLRMPLQRNTIDLYWRSRSKSGIKVEDFSTDFVSTYFEEKYYDVWSSKSF